jgi:hypothetical protein
MKITIMTVKAMAALFIVIMFSGCVTQTMQPKSVGSFSGGPPKVPLAVELRLSDDYRSTVWSKELIMRNSRPRVGDHLVLNTEECARASFADVHTKNAPRSINAKPADAVLIPRLTELNVQIPGGGYSKVVTTMSLEWSLQDPSGKLIWVDTFKAESRGPAPASPGRDQFERRFDAMFQEVFSNSYRAMTSSPEIRGFAERVGTAVR